MQPNANTDAIEAHRAGRVLGREARRPSKRGANRRRLLYPGIIVVALITQIPFIATLYLSFQSWNLGRPLLGRHFIGLDNYRDEVFSSDTLHVIVRTLALAGGTLLLCCVLGLGLAVLLNRDFPGKAVAQTLLITPFFVMPVVTGLMWKNELFNPTIGIVAYIAKVLGAQKVDLLASHPLLMVITMVTWEWMPLFVITLLAGLQSVPEEEKQAASLDGCGPLGVFRHIELPHLLPYYRMVTLLGAIFILQVFGEIQISTNGGPGNSSMNLQLWTYQRALDATEIGQASAIGVAGLVVTLAVLFILLKVSNLVVGDEAND